MFLGESPKDFLQKLENVREIQIHVQSRFRRWKHLYSAIGKDTFFALFHHPFIGRFVEDGFENAAEGGDAVAAQLCELLYGLYLFVVL